MTLFKLYRKLANTYEQQSFTDLAFHAVKCGSEHPRIREKLRIKTEEENNFFIFDK